MCENKLMEKVDAKNAIDMLVVAEMYTANDLKRVAKDTIKENGKHFLFHCHYYYLQLWPFYV